jgi:hypothetical protein
MQPENKQIIRDWLKRRVTIRDWPTLREVKEQIVAELEQIGVEAAPSKSCYTRCLARLLRSDFVVRVAQPLEEDRFNVKIEDIVQHFANLEELEISHISLRSSSILMEQVSEPRNPEGRCFARLSCRNRCPRSLFSRKPVIPILLPPCVRSPLLVMF